MSIIIILLVILIIQKFCMSHVTGEFIEVLISVKAIQVLSGMMDYPHVYSDDSPFKHFSQEEIEIAQIFLNNLLRLQQEGETLKLGMSKDRKSFSFRNFSVIEQANIVEKWQGSELKFSSDTTIGELLILLGGKRKGSKGSFLLTKLATMVRAEAVTKRNTILQMRKELIGPLLETISLMHELGLAHRDLNPKNIYVKGREIKVGDPEAKVIKGEYNFIPVGGRFQYAPPQQFSDMNPLAAKDPQAIWQKLIAQDRYALICLVYELASGKKLLGRDHELYQVCEETVLMTRERLFIKESLASALPTFIKHTLNNAEDLPSSIRNLIIDLLTQLDLDGLRSSFSEENIKFKYLAEARQRTETGWEEVLGVENLKIEMIFDPDGSFSWGIEMDADLGAVGENLPFELVVDYYTDKRIFKVHRAGNSLVLDEVVEGEDVDEMMFLFGDDSGFNTIFGNKGIFKYFSYIMKWIYEGSTYLAAVVLHLTFKDIKLKVSLDEGYVRSSKFVSNKSWGWFSYLRDALISFSGPLFALVASSISAPASYNLLSSSLPLYISIPASLILLSIVSVPGIVLGIGNLLPRVYVTKDGVVETRGNRLLSDLARLIGGKSFFRLSKTIWDTSGKKVADDSKFDDKSKDIDPSFIARVVSVARFFDEREADLDARKRLRVRGFSDRCYAEIFGDEWDAENYVRVLEILEEHGFISGRGRIVWDAKKLRFILDNSEKTNEEIAQSLGIDAKKVREARYRILKLSSPEKYSPAFISIIEKLYQKMTAKQVSEFIGGRISARAVEGLVTRKIISKKRKRKVKEASEYVDEFWKLFVVKNPQHFTRWEEFVEDLTADLGRTRETVRKKYLEPKGYTKAEFDKIQGQHIIKPVWDEFVKKGEGSWRDFMRVIKRGNLLPRREGFRRIGPFLISVGYSEVALRDAIAKEKLDKALKDESGLSDFSGLSQRKKSSLLSKVNLTELMNSFSSAEEFYQTLTIFLGDKAVAALKKRQLKAKERKQSIELLNAELEEICLGLVTFEARRLNECYDRLEYCVNISDLYLRTALDFVLRKITLKTDPDYIEAVSRLTRDEELREKITNFLKDQLRQEDEDLRNVALLCLMRICVNSRNVLEAAEFIKEIKGEVEYSLDFVPVLEFISDSESYSPNLLRVKPLKHIQSNARRLLRMTKGRGKGSPLDALVEIFEDEDLSSGEFTRAEFESKRPFETRTVQYELENLRDLGLIVPAGKIGNAPKYILRSEIRNLSPPAFLQFIEKLNTEVPAINSKTIPKKQRSSAKAVINSIITKFKEPPADVTPAVTSTAAVTKHSSPARGDEFPADSLSSRPGSPANAGDTIGNAGAPSFLTLDEAFQFVTQNDIWQESDRRFSMILAKEILNHPINKILVVGSGLRVFPILMALVGKEVVFVDEDKMTKKSFDYSVTDSVNKKLEKDARDSNAWQEIFFFINPIF